MIRDKKNRLLIQCFKRLGFHRNEYFSKHRRGVYHSYIYTNSKEYLCSKITENKLIKAFDNDLANPLSPLTGLYATLTFPIPNVAKITCYFDPNKINLSNGVKFTSKIKGCYV